MNYRKIMLVALVLLAVLTIGAVSASGDADNLAAAGGDDLDIESPLDDEILSLENTAVAVGDGNITDGNDEPEPEIDNVDDIDVNGSEVDDGTGEEDSFEVLVDDDPQGFDVSAPDLSGYFIGSVTVPENMNGNISIITENDEFLFNKALDDFDSNHTRDNIYDITLSDEGRYIFEGVDDGTLFRFAFLDDEGTKIWESSNYKLVIEGNTIWLRESDDGEGSNDIEFWINTEDWFLTFPGELSRIFATVTVPEGSNGFVAFFNGERELYKKNLNDFDADYINGTTYGIALEEEGNFIFDCVGDDGNDFRFVFLDEDGNELAGMDYFVFFGNSSVRFEADAHNPGDHVSIDVSGEELSTDDENDFVWINLPSYITEGKVIVTSGDYTLFEEAVNFDEGTHWWREIDDHYVCSFAPNSLTNLDKLNDGDSVFFAFLDENGDEIESKEYAITFGEDTVRFEEVQHMQVNIWDENDERGTLYTDSEGNVLAVDIPPVFEGNIIVTVNGNEVDNWEIETDDEDGWAYKDWGLEELRISDAGNYTIEVVFDDGDNHETILNKTIGVHDFNGDTFRAMIQYTTETIRLYVPDGTEGTVTIITEKETEGDELEKINEETYEITPEDYGNWKVWSLEDLGFEADGAFRIFTLTVTNTNDEEVYRYKIAHVGGEDEDEGGDEHLEDIMFVFNTLDDDGYMEFNKTSYVDLGRVFIPQMDEFDGIDVTLYITLNGQQYATINVRDLYGFYSERLNALGFEVGMDMTNFNDKDMLVFRLEAEYENGESAIIEDEVYDVLILEDKGTYFIGHDDYNPERLEYRVFYGNLTTGDTNDPNLMGANFHDRFVIITLSNALNITDGTVTVSDGNAVIFSKSLSDCDRSYDYGSVGYQYIIGLDEVKNAIPEGKDLIIAFNYGNNSLIQKRIRFEDYLYTIILPEDIENQFHFEVNDDLLIRESDSAIHLWTDTNRQAIYFDLGGGYFTIYVNGVKVENLGRVSYNTWLNEGSWREDDTYLDDFDSNEDAFLDYVASYWGSELELFRLTSWHEGAPEIDITLADLGINESGTYNIRIVHYPSVAGGLDDHSSLGIYSEYAGEALSPTETEFFNENITCNFDPDYAGVEILKERIYKNGQPFLFTFQFGENVLSESNRVLVYLNGKLAFNSATLFWEENDEGEMELVELGVLNDGMFNEEFLNEYGVLDVGEYEAVVYLIIGNGTPVEIGRDNFTVMNQKGNMSFEMESSVDEWDERHTVLYVDIPEGDWEGYSLSINIADSEEIYPDEEDWFARWYNEYVIFKDDEIYFKDSLDKIIGKGRVAIDLGELNDKTHIWVVYGNGEETVFNGGDFYQYDFIVKYPAGEPDYSIGIDDEIYVNRLWDEVISIYFDDDVTGTLTVLLDGKEVYNTTLTGYDDFYIDAGDLGFDENSDYGNYAIDVIYSGDGDYKGFTVSKNVTLTYRFSVYFEHEYEMSGYVYGRKIWTEVYVPYDETSKLTYVLNGVEHEVVDDMGEYSFYLDSKDMIYGDNNISFTFVSDNYPTRTINYTIWTRGAIIPSSLYVEYGEPINFELALPEDAKGTLNIYYLDYDWEWVDDLEEYIRVNENYILLDSAPVENGLARIVISDLDIGTYTLYANYTGNYDDVAMYLDLDEENWNAHVEPNLNVPDRIWANGTYTVEFKIPQKYNGVLNVTIGEDTISCNVINGSATFDLFNIDAAESDEWDDYNYLTIYYSFADDENGIEYSSYKSVNVLYVNPQFQLEIGDYEYQVVVKDLERYGVSFYLPDDARGNITVYLDDEYYDVVDVSWGYASASIEVDNLTVGKHNVRFEYSGDGYFVPSTAYDSFNVTDIDLIIPDWVILGKFHDGEFTNGAYVKALDDATGEAKLIIDGVEVETKAIYGGETKFSLSNLTVGNHTVTLIYKGNYGFLNKTSKVEAGYSYFLEFGEVRYGGYADVYFPIGATGEVTATIDGKEFKANIDEMGIARFHIEGIVAGEYEATVSYAGNDKYPADSQTFNTTVYYAVIADFPYEIYESDLANYAIELTLPENATGKLVIYDYFDDEPFMTVNLTDGKAKITLADLVSAAGGHGGYFELLIGYDGDDYDDVRRSYSDFTVVGHKIVGPENAGHVILGDTVEYTVQFSTNLTGRLRVYDGDRDDHVVLYDNITIKNGVAKFSIEASTLGSKYYELEYVGDDYELRDSVHFMVWPENVTLTDIVSNDDVILAVKLPSASSGNLTVVMLSDKHGRLSPIVNYYGNVAAVLASDMPAGKWTLVNFIIEDEKYGDFYFSSTSEYYGNGFYDDFRVIEEESKMPANLTVSTSDINVGDIAVINIAINENVTGKVTVNGIEVNVTNGAAKYEIKDLAAGDYTYTVKFAGDDKFTPSEKTVAVKVSKLASDVNVTVGSAYNVGDSFIIAITNNTAAVVTINGNAYAIKDGKVDIDTTTLTAGSYTVVANITENDKFLASSDSATFTVSKVASSVKVDVGSAYNVGDSFTIAITNNTAAVVTINGNAYAIKDGKVDIDTTALAAGSYTVVANITESDKYLANSDTATFTISKVAAPAVVIDVESSVVEGTDLAVEVTVAGATGTVIINGEEKQLNNSKASAIIKNVTVGDLTISVAYSGDAKYLNASNSTTVNVFARKDAELTAVGADIKVGEVAEISITINKDVTGKLIVNGEEVTVVDGTAKYAVAGLTAGNHTFAVKFAGDKYFNAAETTVVVKVSKVASSVKVTVGSAYNVGDSFTISIANSTAVKVVINGQEYAVKDGAVVIDTTKLAAGSYIVVASIAEDDMFLASSDSASFEVSKVETPAGENPFNFDENKTVESKTPTYSIDLPQDAKGTLTVTIGDKTYTAEVKDGKATVAINDLPAGSYDVTITYSGDDKYSPIVKTSKATVKVDPRIDAKDAKVQYTAGKYYSVTVYGDDGKVAPKGTQVIFTLNGKKVKTTTTDANGVAKFKVTQTPVTNARIVAKALGVTATKKLTITHAATLKTITVKKSAKKITLKVTVKVNGKVLKNKVVKFKFNNKYISTKKALKTNIKGVATVDVPTNYYTGLKVGKTVTYQVTYLKDTVKKSTKVKA